jgi:hypothetical protein
MVGIQSFVVLSVLAAESVFAGPAMITPAPHVRRDDQAFIGWTDAGVFGTSTSCKLEMKSSIISCRLLNEDVFRGYQRLRYWLYVRHRQ